MMRDQFGNQVYAVGLDGRRVEDPIDLCEGEWWDANLHIWVPATTREEKRRLIRDLWEALEAGEEERE